MNNPVSKSARRVSVCSVCAAIVFLTMAGPARSQTLVEEIVNYVDSLESVLSTAAAGNEARAASLNAGDKFLSTLMRRHPVIVSILKVNSKGAVTNEAVRDGKKGKRLRVVGKQDWFRNAGGKMEPHYGSIKPRNAGHQLFWALPVISTTNAGVRRSAGVLVFKIDLGKCLQNVARKTNTPFRIESEGIAVFQNDWRGRKGEGTLFDIKGFTGLTIIQEPVKPTPPPAPSTVASAPVSAPAGAPVVETQTPASSNKPVSTAPAVKKKSGGLTVLFFSALLLLLAVAGFFLWRYVIRYMEMKNQRVLDEIDRSDELPAVMRKTGEFPKGIAGHVMARSEIPVKAMGGATRRIPMPDVSTGLAPAGVVPGVQSGFPGMPMQPVPGGLPAGLSVDDYERIRAQIRAETIPELRRHLEGEFERYRTDVVKNSEAFTSQVTLLLHQLIGKISELGDNPTRLTEVVGASIHELNGLVNRHRGQPPK